MVLVIQNRVIGMVEKAVSVFNLIFKSSGV